MRYQLRVIITGPMGTGKTTVSNLLTTTTGISNLDSDSKVIQLTILNIKMIFGVLSEMQFRKWEFEMTHGFLMTSIFNTGGGVSLISQFQHRLRRTMTLSFQGVASIIIPRLRTSPSRSVIPSETYWQKRFVPTKLCARHHLRQVRTGLLGTLIFGVSLTD